MPYIKHANREPLDYLINSLAEKIYNVGELNYAVTRLALRLLKRQGLSYTNIAGIIGTLHLIPLELQDRLLRHYENEKCQANGDLPELADNYFSN